MEHYKKGFTLIELILTIIIVGITAVPLSLLLSQHLESTFVSKDYTVATNLARLEMEQVLNMDYDSIVTVNYLNYQGYNYDLDRSVDFVQGDESSAESLKGITIDVRRSSDPARLIDAVTYIARNINYGL